LGALLAGGWTPWWRALNLKVPYALIVYGAITVELETTSSTGRKYSALLPTPSASGINWPLRFLLLVSAKLGLSDQVNGIVLLVI
jgi:hypothetical protein